jgi:hypothetical protein
MGEFCQIYWTGVTLVSENWASVCAMAKAAFNKTKNLFISKLNLNFRKKLIICYTWSIALWC